MAKKQSWKCIPRTGEKRPTASGLAPVEPETFLGCPHWNWFENTVTGETHMRPCGHCWQCKNAKHQRIVGAANAEASISACVISLTLTIADVVGPDGQKTTPDAALHLDYAQVDLFLKRLRRAGYSVKKICAGEYGGKHGRAHWHLLLFFQWPPEMKALVLEDVFKNASDSLVKQRLLWRQSAPPMLANLKGSKFVEKIKDPDVLVVSMAQGSKTAKIRNTWRFWPHGLVEAQMVSSPDDYGQESIEAAVRYVVKYLTKDPWKDSPSYNQIPFENLPEHIRQATKFGPWYNSDEIAERREEAVKNGSFVRSGDDAKWRSGNPYAKEIEENNLKLYPCDADVPLERRLKKNIYKYRSRGGLGGEYFFQLGRWYADHGSENLTKQSYQIGSNYRKNQPSVITSAIARGKLPTTARKRFKYHMSKTCFRKFWDGFNAQLLLQEREETSGPNHVYADLLSQAQHASDMSSGAFGLNMWNKDPPAQLSANAQIAWRKKHRDTLAFIWGEMTDKQLRGLVPIRLRKELQRDSPHPGWKKRRANALWQKKFGKLRNRTRFADFEIIETDRFFVFRKYHGKNVWYERPILTEWELDTALSGNLLAVNATSGRRDVEPDKQGKLIADMDRRTVRKRIAVRLAQCPF